MPVIEGSRKRVCPVCNRHGLAYHYRGHQKGEFFIEEHENLEGQPCSGSGTKVIDRRGRPRKDSAAAFESGRMHAKDKRRMDKVRKEEDKAVAGTTVSVDGKVSSDELGRITDGKISGTRV